MHLDSAKVRQLFVSSVEVPQYAFHDCSCCAVLQAYDLQKEIGMTQETIEAEETMADTYRTP